MVIVIEKALDGTILGITSDGDGGYLTFDNYDKANEYAKKNCAFEYDLVKI